MNAMRDDTNVKEAAPAESCPGAKVSLLPSIMAAVAMLGFSAIQVIGMLAYNWGGGGTLYMLVVGAFAYLATKGYQQWRAACPLVRQR